MAVEAAVAVVTKRRRVRPFLGMVRSPFWTELERGLADVAVGRFCLVLACAHWLRRCEAYCTSVGVANGNRSCGARRASAGPCWPAPRYAAGAFFTFSRVVGPEGSGCW